MLPRSSSSTGQRRSSILKPPKTRLPFQDLDFNTSSIENSPEGTRKRRVSFADKKHVKEFCDHKEQGTIWDSTYEEPDQNISKSTEISNENADRINVETEYAENVDIAGLNLQRANEDLINSGTYVIMDPSSVENTSKNIFYSSGTSLEFTDVIIPCSRGTSNVSMSKTVFCEDVDLDVTETIGGIEPTVSVKTIANLQAREIGDTPCLQQGIKSTEPTMIFDQSGGTMNFTEVISGQKIQTLMPQNLASYQELEKSNSFIENQTIIFEDSVMDLTLTKSLTEVNLNLEENRETNFSQGSGNGAEKENIRLGSNANANDCESLQTSNKTVFFNDFGCDFTEAINPVLHPVPEMNLVKEKLAVEIQTPVNNSRKTFADPQKNTNCSTTSEKNNLSNGSDSTLTTSDTHSNKTIFFNNFGCEMTEAINTLRTVEARDEIVDKTNEAEQIVPQQLIATSREVDMQLEIEPCESQSIYLSSKRDAESSPTLISGCNDTTKFFNDSVMEFTTAISREKNADLRVEENIATERNRTEIFHNCDVDITEDVRTPICSMNSGPNSGEKGDLFSFELESSEAQSKNKRNFCEIEANIDCSKPSNSLISKNTVHDLVQSLVHDESVHVTNDRLATNCKRLKVADVNAEEDSLTVEDEVVTVSELAKNITSTTMTMFSPNTQDIPKTQIQISGDVEVPKDCVTSLAANYEEPITEDVAVAASLNCCSCDQDKSAIDDNVEAETRKSLKSTEDDVSEEEPSFVEATLAHLNSDSESETLELSRVYEKKQLSLLEKSNNVQSCLEPDECLENNDDCCFLMFSEELERHANSENCIWTIRSLDEKKVLIDFISKSLVVVIDLEASEELTTPRTIKDIQIISLLGDTECKDIAMIHDILLKKLDPENLKRLHRTTQDIIPLLELISHKVRLLLDFMYEFDKLQDLHLINRSGNRISFRLHSYKVQLVIKMTIDLEPFEDIGPNDVRVECILGNIREKDIKHLITSVKKDYKFLTNYINDIKEYIALVAEK